MVPTAVIVAIVAAVASVGSAVIAYRAAGRAANSSEQIARESHGVTAIDRQSDELREAFNRFVEAFADARDLSKQLQVTARLDQLRSCLGATAELDVACSSLSDAIRSQSALNQKLHEAIGPPMFARQLRTVSTAYRDSQMKLLAERAAALSDEAM